MAREPIASLCPLCWERGEKSPVTYNNGVVACTRGHRFNAEDWQRAVDMYGSGIPRNERNEVDGA